MPLVESGLEVLVRRRAALLRGQRVALLTHQASIDSRYTHAVTLVRELSRVKVARLLAPEHGLWGAPQDHVWIDGARDPTTGLPVWSLYGARREPSPASHGQARSQQERAIQWRRRSWLLRWR